MQVKVGSFAQPSSTGNQAITGVGFTPKIVLFFIETNNTSDASMAGLMRSVGAMDANNQFCNVDACADATTNYGPFRDRSTSKCVGALSTAGSVVAQAGFVSLDSDGFTIDWTTVDATARVVNYIAIGGIAGSHIGTYTAPTSTGTFAVTGVGFMPDCVLQFGGEGGSLSTDPTTSAVKTGLGAFSAIEAGASVAWIANSANTSAEYQHGDTFTSLLSNSALADEAVFTSMDTDGFTQNFTTAQAGATNQIFYVALKGCKIKIGTLSQPSSTGNQSVSGLSFHPKVVLFVSGAHASSSSVNAAARSTIGAGSSASNRFSLALAASDSSSNVSLSSDLDRAKVIKCLTQGGGSPTVNAAADLVSLDAAGFTIDWTTVDATAREILYIALGEIITSQTQAGKARIQVTSDQTQAGVARIQVTTPQTQPGKARIQVTSDQTQAGVARIQVTTPQTQPGKARIQVTSDQTQAGVARIQVTTPQTQPGKARIQVTTPQTIAGKASIAIPHSVQTIIGKANIRATTLQAISGRAHIITIVPTPGIFKPAAVLGQPGGFRPFSTTGTPGGFRPASTTGTPGFFKKK